MKSATKTRADRSIMALLLDPMRLDRIAAAVDRMGASDTSVQVHLIIDQAQADLGADNAAFVVLADTRSIVIAAHNGPPMTIDTADTFCRYVGDDTPFRVPNSSENLLVCDLGATAGIGSYLGVPVLFAGYVLGALCVWNRLPRDWTDDDLTRLTALAAQLTEWWKT